MKNPKAKGGEGERRWAKWLREYNVDESAGRNVSSGSGIYKSDIHNQLQINFEVKTCKRVSLKKVMEQSERDANMTHTVPYAVIHLDGMPDNTWYIVMSNWDWLDLWKKSQAPKVVETTQNQRAKWLTRGAIKACKDLLKYLEGK